MNMKDGIHHVQPASGIGSTTPAATVSETQRQQQLSSFGGVSAGSDRTEVSTAASLANQAMSISDTRMDRVHALQLALADGSYVVGAEDISAKVLSHMLGE